MAKRARLDRSGTAQPLTSIVAHVPTGYATGPSVAFRQATTVQLRKRYGKAERLTPLQTEILGDLYLKHDAGKDWTQCKPNAKTLRAIRSLTRRHIVAWSYIDGVARVFLPGKASGNVYYHALAVARKAAEKVGNLL